MSLEVKIEKRTNRSVDQGFLYTFSLWFVEENDVVVCNTITDLPERKRNEKLKSKKMSLVGHGETYKDDVKNFTPTDVGGVDYFNKKNQNSAQRPYWALDEPEEHTPEQGLNNVRAETLIRKLLKEAIELYEEETY